MRMNIRIEGHRQTARDLQKTVDNFQTKAYSVTRHYGTLLAGQIRANARRSFQVTDYDRKIKKRMGTGGIHYPLVEVGTDVEYGFRLELGFHGIDAAGRVIDQPARPHFGPAMDNIGPAYERAIARLLNKL